MAGRGRGGQGSDAGTGGASERALFGSDDRSGTRPLRTSGQSVSEPVIGAQRDLAMLFGLKGPAEDVATEADAGAAPGAAAPDGSEEQSHPYPGAPPAAFARLVHRLRRLSPRRIAVRIASAATTELDRGIAFLLIPVFLAAGTVAYFALPAEPGMLHPAVTAAALAALALATRNRPKAHLACVACLLVALGFVAGKVETWRSEGLTLGSEISTSLTGRVVAIDDMANGRVRLTLDVLSTARPKLRYQPARARLSARVVPAGVQAGSVVTGFARLLPPTGPVRPGSYDFSFESYFEGLGASGFFLTNPKLAAVTDTPSFVMRLDAGVENFRDRIADHIRAVIPGPEGEIAAALIVGVRAGIPDAVNDAMRRTGIYHIISISGLHMALVAGTIMALLRGAFAMFPVFSSRRPVKKYAAVAALVSIAAYLLISGVVVAAERSFIMLAVMLIAVLFDRAALTMRNLAISAIAVVVVSPHEVVGPSFQMSFAATAALVAAFAGWSDRRGARNSGSPPPRRGFARLLGHRLFATISGVALTSIIAGSATALFAVWHFQRVSPLSLFANLAVMPIVSAVMGLAVLAVMAMPFGADWPFLYAMGKGLTAMIAVSDWISARSPIDAVGLISLRSVVLVTVALVIATMTTTWLRLAALPLALAGLLTIHQVRTPGLLISEDGRLAAMPIGGGELAVSRPKPSQFTVDNWRHALDAETVVPPQPVKGDDARFAFGSPTDLPPGTPFLCASGLCVARHPSGAIVVLARTAKQAAPSCAYATVIVIDDATAPDPCDDPLVAVITTQDLAIEGSAAVYFDPRDAQAAPDVQFAVETDYRPWHVQRQYAREARGLPPIGKKHNKSTAAKARDHRKFNHFGQRTNSSLGATPSYDASPDDQ